MHATWHLTLRAVLGLHIAMGAIAFLCAPVALLTAKGGRNHRRWGKVYFWAMAGVAATALFLSIALPIVFLALVAVFSFYAAFSGYRILCLKDLNRGGKARWMDWLAAWITLVASAALALLGALRPHIVGGMGLVSIVFGLIGVRLAFDSIRTFLRPGSDKQFWWYFHMRGMIASYIAAFTAFTVVNLAPHFGNAWWIWLGPAIVGVPGLILWQRYYQTKFSRKPTTAVGA